MVNIIITVIKYTCTVASMMTLIWVVEYHSRSQFSSWWILTFICLIGKWSTACKEIKCVMHARESEVWASAKAALFPGSLICSRSPRVIEENTIYIMYAWMRIFLSLCATKIFLCTYCISLRKRHVHHPSQEWSQHLCYKRLASCHHGWHSRKVTLNLQQRK